MGPRSDRVQSLNHGLGFVKGPGRRSYSSLFDSFFVKRELKIIYLCVILLYIGSDVLLIGG
jgi:hypothetical protein